MRALLTMTVLAGLGTGGVYAYRFWDGPSGETTYTTVDVKRGSIVSTVSATGNVEPVIKVLVGSQVSGTVIRWYADFNQMVKEGEVLAELDQDRYRAELDQRSADVSVACARVEEASAMLSQATLERQRIERAFEQAAASDFEWQNTRAVEAAASATLNAVKAQVDAAEANRLMSAIQLEKTIIRSPIDGVVISRDVDAGQTVAASLSAPTLFTIANDLAKMRVNAAVSETDIGKVREHMEAEFRVDAYPGRRFRGLVTQVRYAETVVDNVVTYTTLIDVDNPDLALRPGMTATILFEVDKVDDTLKVPNAALRFSPGAAEVPTDWNRPQRGQALKPRVYRLTGDRLVEVSLELGLNDGTFTQIKAGEIKDGDKVVVEEKNPRSNGSRAAPQQRMPRMM